MKKTIPVILKDFILWQTYNLWVGNQKQWSTSEITGEITNFKKKDEKIIVENWEKGKKKEEN